MSEGFCAAFVLAFFRNFVSLGIVVGFLLLLVIFSPGTVFLREHGWILNQLVCEYMNTIQISTFIIITNW